eukprot:TRINITY_DN66633_c7_g1_i1.p1 TRINITY_DN66633_c7_g1~~TRINITY_DN66633_c7_g1_i1.p1  ORF type:complete len:932 (-),score=435.86 TRINITY_DN66633_c7_g1_i1:76-2871(-)
MGGACCSREDVGQTLCSQLVRHETRQLRMSYYEHDWHDERVQQVLAALLQNQSVVVVRLHELRWTKASFRMLSRIVASHSAIRELHLYGDLFCVAPDHWRLLMDTLVADGCRVSTLALPNQRLDDRLAQQLADVVRSSHCITSLDVSGNLMTGPGVSALCRAVMDQPMQLITSLNLRGNWIGDGVDDLHTLIQHHPRLTRVDVDLRHDVTDEGARLLHAANRNRVGGQLWAADPYFDTDDVQQAGTRSLKRTSLRNSNTASNNHNDSNSNHINNNNHNVGADSMFNDALTAMMPSKFPAPSPPSQHADQNSGAAALTTSNAHGSKTMDFVSHSHSHSRGHQQQQRKHSQSLTTFSMNISQSKLKNKRMIQNSGKRKHSTNSSTAALVEPDVINPTKPAWLGPSSSPNAHHSNDDNDDDPNLINSNSNNNNNNNNNSNPAVATLDDGAVTGNHRRRPHSHSLTQRQNTHHLKQPPRRHGHHRRSRSHHHHHHHGPHTPSMPIDPMGLPTSTPNISASPVPFGRRRSRSLSHMTQYSTESRSPSPWMQEKRQPFLNSLPRYASSSSLVSSSPNVTDVSRGTPTQRPGSRNRQQYYQAVGPSGVEHMPPGEIECRLGYCFMYGLFFKPVDVQRARLLTLVAARKGHPLAMAKVALEGWGTAKPNTKLGLRILKEWKSKGSVAATNALGVLYLRGKGVEHDARHAMDLMLRAASAGDPCAQYNVGVCLLFGWGRPRSGYGGETWLRRAAQQGHVEAQHLLGQITSNDYVRSRRFFHAAARQNHAPSMLRLALILDKGAVQKNEDGSITVHAQRKAKAFEWFKKSADLGNRVAMQHLARIYKSGVPRQSDEDEQQQSMIERSRRRAPAPASTVAVLAKSDMGMAKYYRRKAKVYAEHPDYKDEVQEHPDLPNSYENRYLGIDNIMRIAPGQFCVIQ